MRPVAVDPHASDKEDVKTLLREATEMADRGEAIGVAMAIVSPAGETVIKVAIGTSHADLIGRLMLLVHRICAEGWESTP